MYQAQSDLNHLLANSHTCGECLPAMIYTSLGVLVGTTVHLTGDPPSVCKCAVTQVYTSEER